MAPRKKLTLQDLTPRSDVPGTASVVADRDRVHLRIEGRTDLPNPAQPAPHECRADAKGQCIWARCPRGAGKRCPVDHAREWQDFNRR